MSDDLLSEDSPFRWFIIDSIIMSINRMIEINEIRDPREEIIFHDVNASG
jgi:hypothetical protein